MIWSQDKSKRNEDVNVINCIYSHSASLLTTIGTTSNCFVLPRTERNRRSWWGHTHCGPWKVCRRRGPEVSRAATKQQGENNHKNNVTGFQRQTRDRGNVAEGRAAGRSRRKLLQDQAAVDGPVLIYSLWTGPGPVHGCSRTQPCSRDHLCSTRHQLSSLPAAEHRPVAGTYGRRRWSPARSPLCSCRRETFGKRGSFYACH